MGAAHRRAAEADIHPHHSDSDSDDADGDHGHDVAHVADPADGHHQRFTDHHHARTAGSPARLAIAGDTGTGPVADPVALTGPAVDHRYTGVP